MKAKSKTISYLEAKINYNNYCYQILFIKPKGIDDLTTFLNESNFFSKVFDFIFFYEDFEKMKSSQNTNLVFFHNNLLNGKNEDNLIFLIILYHIFDCSNNEKNKKRIIDVITYFVNLKNTKNIIKENFYKILPEIYYENELKLIEIIPFQIEDSFKDFLVELSNRIK